MNDNFRRRNINTNIWKKSELRPVIHKLEERDVTSVSIFTHKEKKKLNCLKSSIKAFKEYTVFSPSQVEFLAEKQHRSVQISKKQS